MKNGQIVNSARSSVHLSNKDEIVVAQLETVCLFLCVALDAFGSILIRRSVDCSRLTAVWICFSSNAMPLHKHRLAITEINSTVDQMNGH